MSQRFNLFYAGFTISLPAVYYSKQNLGQTITSNETEKIDLPLKEYVRNFDHEKEEYDSHLVSALELAKHFEIQGYEKPDSVPDFIDWQTKLIAEFESMFPMGRIEHYYFLYARRLAELIHNMLLLKTCVDIHMISNHQVDMSRYLHKYIKDSEYIIFKLMAPAALLSSEPRQSCFNNLFKQMNEEIKLFKNLPLESASNEELLQLKNSADNFHVLLVNGFKTCIGLLKEL